MTIAQASFQFSLQQAVMALANGDGTYGTAVTVPAAETLDLNVQYIQDTAKGNSKYVALASQIVAVDYTLGGVNMSPDILQILIGSTPSSSGSGASEVDTLDIDNQLMPYAGIVAQAWGQHSDDFCFFIPYSKVMKSWALKVGFGKFATPSYGGEGIEEPSLKKIMSFKWHATRLTTLTFPLA